MHEMRMKPVWVGMMMAVAAMGQTAPSKEYIYLNGRLVAVETRAANVGPTVTSVTPASGSGGSGTFTAVYGDGNGAADIAKGELQVLPSGGTAANGCVARYVKATGLLELLNDAGTAVAGTVTPGGTGSVANSRCTLNAAGSSATASGQTLTVVFPLVYAAGFSGAKDLKLYVATTSHELGHQFLGDPYREWNPWSYTFYREPLVDAKVGEQVLGTSQPRFRDGLEKRRYAAPLNPEANKPRH